HALAGEGPGVLDSLPADTPELRITGGIVLVGGPGVQGAARAELLRVLRVLLAGIVELLRLLLGVQVVEVAEPLVETVHRGQEFVSIPQMVLAELGSGVSLGLENFGKRRIGLLDPARRAGDADGGHAGANGQLSHEERRPAGGTAGLSVMIREEHSLAGDAI